MRNNSFLLKLNKLLACTFAFVLVSSLVFPAYAGQRSDSVVSLPVLEVDQLTAPSSDDNIIYQNGNNPVSGTGFFIDNAIMADDFVLGVSTDVTDAHFVWVGDGISSNIEPLGYFILADAGSQPGAVIDSGTAQNVQTMALGNEHFETWFDFEVPVPLDGGVTYWFALTYTPATFDIEAPEPAWQFSDVVTGIIAFRATSLPPTTWSPNGEGIDLWFQLTGDDLVGGEFLPIDNTALLLAAAQSPSAWLTALTIAALGIGAYVFTRNSSNMRNIKVILRNYLDRF